MDVSKQPTQADLMRLYELAAELKELAPWRWMDEGEVFGVENPETGQIGFVSVMGAIGEHTALAVYLGAEGLYGFLDLEEDELEIDPFALLEIPQLQVSFEDRDMLERRDRDEIKKLGLKFRGAGNYPLFRSIGWGFLPWHISADEARFLIYAIEQTLVVAPRVEEDPLILMVDDDEYGEKYLIRVAEEQKGSLIWRDEIRTIREPEPEIISFELPEETIALLKGFPQRNDLVFEIDLFRAPTPLLNKENRPMLPKMLMIAESRSLLILGVELIEPAENASKLVESVAESVIKILSRHKVRPKAIHAGTDMLYRLFRGFAQKLNIELRQTDDLPAIDEACEEMFREF